MKKIKLRTTNIEVEQWNDEIEDYDYVNVAPEIVSLIEEKLTEARKYIDEASKVAKANNVEFKPLGDLFSNDEIESQGWSSSHC